MKIKTYNTLETLDYYDDNYFEDNLGITKNDYLNKFKRYIIKIDDQYYFQKRIYNIFLYNELIGRYLRNKINLETTSLDIISKDIITSKIVTSNYRNPRYKYLRVEDHFKEEDNTKMFNDSFFFLLDKSFQEELLKLIAIDLMMEQTDRYARNMEIYIKENSPKLAPIVDFELAFFGNRNFTYFNPYLLINKNVKSLDQFYNKYPNGYKYLEDTFSTTSNELFDYINKEYDLKVNQTVQSSIRGTIRTNEKILKKLKG